MLTIIEGMQLLSEGAYVTEYTLLCCMRRDLMQHLRLLLYGVNDCTVPPVALYPYVHIYTGLRGRPRVFINIESVELLRSCGYTWNEVASDTIWRQLKDAGIQMSKYADISDDELDSIISRFQCDVVSS